MYRQLQKAFGIAKRTGDKIIVLDSLNPDNTFVIMSIDEYEKLALGERQSGNLTEDGLVDKINRDIALSQTEEDELSAYDREVQKFLVEQEKVDADYDEYEDEEDILEEDLTYLEEIQEETETVFDRVDQAKPDAQTEDDKKNKRAWSIPKERKEGAREVVEGEENQVEEITF